MSYDQDSMSGPSLKDLVVDSLQSNGVLGKIQAELKASVYLTLEEEIQQRSIPLVDKKITELLASPAGKLSLSIVRDFITCLGLEFTSSVLESEGNISAIDDVPPREILMKKLNIDNDDNNQNIPVIFQLIKQFQNSSEKSSPTNETSDKKTISDPTSNNADVKANEELLINLNISNEYSHEESSKKSTTNGSASNENYSTEHRDNESSQKDTDDQLSNPSLGSQNAYEEEFASNTESEQKESTENDVITENVEEMIEEDISINDGISSLSEVTDTTKDFTMSEKTDVYDYQEPLFP